MIPFGKGTGLIQVIDSESPLSSLTSVMSDLLYKVWCIVMRKTYFMRVYDIIICLFLFAILTVMFSKLFDLLNIAISQIDIIDMRNVTHYITIISNGLYQLTFYLLGLALILMIINLIICLLKD